MNQINKDRLISNLKSQIEENPLAAVGLGVAAIAALGKFIEQVGHARGSWAYGRQVDHKIKKSKGVKHHGM